jgi:hypothetical protein
MDLPGYMDMAMDLIISIWHQYVTVKIYMDMAMDLIHMAYGWHY